MKLSRTSFCSATGQINGTFPVTYSHRLVWGDATVQCQSVVGANVHRLRWGTWVIVRRGHVGAGEI